MFVIVKRNSIEVTVEVYNRVFIKVYKQNKFLRNHLFNAFDFNASNKWQTEYPISSIQLKQFNTVAI